MMTDFGIVILAAGASSRLGTPKQSLIFNGETLLERIINTALSSQAKIVTLVLGAHQPDRQKNIVDKRLHIVNNNRWSEGLSTSIRSGLAYCVAQFPALEGVIFTVCDQPFVTTTLLNDLLSKFKQTGRPIVASAYENTMGIPVFFHRSLFGELMELNGEKGARQLLNYDSSRVATVPFLAGGEDIDTISDYERLVKKQHK